MTATKTPLYSPTVDITSLLRSWCSPGAMDNITMAHVRFDMTVIDNVMRPRLNRVKELESEMAQLRTELDVLSSTQDNYHSFHAPIRHLPPEVLLSIFSHLEPRRMPRENDAPWVLTRVCSSWRDLVTHTPALWSTISVDSWIGRWNIPVDLELMLALLTCSLRYSNGLPLDIILTSLRLEHPYDRITLLLKQHSERWCSLIADSDRFIPNDLPALESLELRMRSKLFNTLQAPRLHTLVLGEIYSIPFSRFPSLRCLECSMIHGTQLVTLLEDAKQLTSLRVHFRRLDSERSPSVSISSNLLRLHLPHQVPEALSHISFPLLHSLTLGRRYSSAYDSGEINILDNFHCPRLRTLILNDPISIPAVLSHPITRLDLTVNGECSSYAQDLTPLLNLEDLRIRIDRLPPMSREIISLVEAIRKKGLRYLEIKSPSSETRELLRAIFPKDWKISFSHS
ncbi:hypothetical protein EDD18DRAFT_1333946 [Armillaria luteobubalina]|uniref:F-box domain-containing protein n=1 Tax=Armillaria luteobubalina TaxID=153913 RepID=A0AA39TKS2_9AGAR|nr:hypothetical protein EDD18DRAFT_1333946 [Armillaria luteobubalina]